MKGGPTCIVASRRRRNEMTSRDWQLAHQRLQYRAGITAAPTPNPEGPRRRDDEPMMKLRRRKPIVCDRVDKNGSSQAQSNEDHTSSPSARPARRGRWYQTLPKDQAGRAAYDLQHLLLSTPLSHLGLITALHSILVSLLCVWAASSALSALPRAS